MESCFIRVYWIVLGWNKNGIFFFINGIEIRINMFGLECCLLVIEMDIFRYLFIYDNFCGWGCLLFIFVGIGLFCGRSREG